jgi:hypothetical protein
MFISLYQGLAANAQGPPTDLGDYKPRKLPD